MKRREKRTDEEPRIESTEFDAMMHKALGVPRPPNRELPGCNHKKTTAKKAIRKEG